MLADHRSAEDVLAQRDLELRFVRLVLGRLEDLAEIDRLARVVRHLDPDRGLARQRRHDAHAPRLHGERKVVGEVHDLAHLDARRRLELEHGHDRAGIDLRDPALDVEVLELAREQLGLGEHVLLGNLLGDRREAGRAGPAAAAGSRPCPCPLVSMNSKVACTGFGLGCFSGLGSFTAGRRRLLASTIFGGSFGQHGRCLASRAFSRRPR